MKNEVKAEVKKGRPPMAKKPEVRIEVQGEYTVLFIPTKDLTRKLLAPLFN